MRKIAVITGSRAEYGLLFWTLKALQSDPDINLQLIVTGMHMLPQFGNTIEAIRNDGFDIAAEVPMDLRGDGSADMARATASVLAGMTDALEKLQPDMALVLGDRFEILATAQACLCLKIPLGHIHGGEQTQGNIDESIRHAITKMAHLHFVAAPEFHKRVIQLGENPDHVHLVGAVGLESFFAEKLPSRAALEQALNFKFGAPCFMVTYHPVTLDDNDPALQAQALCTALDRFPNASIILTGANADAGGQRMNDVYEEYAAKNPGRVLYRTSLGHLNYLAMLKEVTVVIGNSSSGLIEAPSAGVPTVNIGDRQKGRLMPPSVINCPADSDSIAAAIARALSSEAQAQVKKCDNPYFSSKRPSLRIAELIKSVKLDGMIRKPFFDL